MKVWRVSKVGKVGVVCRVVAGAGMEGCAQVVDSSKTKFEFPQRKRKKGNEDYLLDRDS